MQRDDDPSASRLVLAYASPDAARPSPSIFQWIIGCALEVALLAGAGLSAVVVLESRDPSLLLLSIGLGGLAWGLYRSLVQRQREAALWMTVITMVLTMPPAFLGAVYLCYERDRGSAMYPLSVSLALGLCAWQFYGWHCALERAAALHEKTFGETDVTSRSSRSPRC